jgi:hypothetical protein
MQIVVALVAFLAGVVSVFVVELQLLNDILAPVEGLFADLRALVAAL